MALKQKCALITGITGQDGSYLAELLLAKGYAIHGIVRRASTDRLSRIVYIADKLTLHEADMLDLSSLIRVVRLVEPDEVYNLASQSFVPTSWDEPIYTSDVTGLGALRMLEAVRIVDDGIRFYQAGSSEMFGYAKETPQSESTPFNPRSPYGAAKVFAHHAVQTYRDSFGMFACSGILFNHESPRRGQEFVTQKIATGAARVKLGLQEHIMLGNLDAKRDWGYAGDYVNAMWLMLQRDRPDDYVVATGETHSVRDFLTRALARVGLDGTCMRTDASLCRPTDLPALCGDATKARKELGWEPRLNFSGLVDTMVASAMARAQAETL